MSHLCGTLKVGDSADFVAGFDIMRFDSTSKILDAAIPDKTKNDQCDTQRDVLDF
jgi:hypothetical protein